MFVAMRMSTWDDFQPSSPIPAFGGFKMPNGCTGFLTVWETAEDAKAWYGDDVVLAEIRPTKEAE
jgi:hypothetical protein